MHRVGNHQPKSHIGACSTYVQRPYLHPISGMTSKFGPNYNFVPATDVSLLISLLLKKNLRYQRLIKFDDDPSNYLVWKGTFKNVISDMKVIDFEQLDLLLRWWGPSSQSKTHIQKSNPSNSTFKKILDRLDERYGSPELVDRCYFE